MEFDRSTIMNKLVPFAVIAAFAALVSGCAAPPRPDTSIAGGPPVSKMEPAPVVTAEPDPGALIAAELGFHGPRERTDLRVED